MRSTTSRALREHLSRELQRAARGEEIVVTRRGRAFVRILPPASSAPSAKYPLRGSIRHVAEDFDAPLDDMFSALER
jgi:prevent-host-death family protein